MKFRYLAVLACLFSLGLFAQEFRGTLSGTITDPTGSAIAGAKEVEVVHVYLAAVDWPELPPPANTPGAPA